MKLSAIALKNLKRNFSFYSLYLCSVSLVLMIFFCFTSFSMNEIIMEKISEDGRVETMCRVVAAFLMVFVVFYMFYSNHFFMRRRMKELGIYALMGYRKSSMLKLLTFENILICVGGLIVGIAAGGLLHKGVTVGITALLHLSIDNSKIPLINPAAVKSNLSFIVVVLFALVLSNARILWKCTLLDLVRLEKKIEKLIRPHALAAVLGVLLLILGYGLAMDIRRGRASVWNTIGFSPIALLTMASVVMGTVLFIYSFLPFVCQRIRGRKQALYQENTIIVVPKFMKHIRSSAKSLILLILLSAGTMAIFGATTLSIWYPYQSLQRIIPSAAEYRVTDAGQRDVSLRTLSDALGENAYHAYETTIVKTTASAEKLPLEYSVSEEKGRVPGFECISLQDCQALFEQQGKNIVLPGLSDEECILIKYHPDDERQDLSAVYHLAIGPSETADVTVVQTTLANPIGFANSVGTLVVSDALYQRLLESPAEKIRVISINGPGMRSNPAVYGALKEAMPDNIYLVSAWQRETDLVSANSSTFLLIGFATIIFLIATGSILYFQNISAVTYDKLDYEIMGRMGYRHRMIKRCVRRQIQIYYLIPYVMGLLHSIFAILCYKSALMDDLLGRSSATIIPILLAVVIFTAIYFVYYQVTKHSCYKAALQ